MHSRFVTVGGYRLHLLEAGRGPAVLLLHGFAGSAEDWRPTGEALARMGYRAIAVDALGFGRSAKPADAPYSLELMAGLLAALLDALGERRAALVAHSMGGKYALATALLHPARVAGLALVATDGFTEASPLTRAGGWPLVGPALLWLSARPAVVRLLLAAAFVEPEAHLTAAILERGRAALLGAENRRALTALSRRYDATDLALTGLRARLGELRAPTLLLWGEGDRVLPLETSGRAAAAEIPGARLLTIPRCGHFPQIEAPRAFRGALAGFLARLKAE
ncbi:MAG TPA: alpha/beta fold hydrolase [Chloroflexaceae bacterium]|nr:alpha/beta fold hydrolase [Chloroflexaceae bacterium]